MRHTRRTRDELLAEQGALGRELELLEEKIEQLNGEVDRLTVLRDNFNRQIGETRGELKQVWDKIRKLEAEQAALPSLAQLLGQLEKLKETREDAARKRNRLQDQHDSLEAEYRRLAGQKTLLLAEQENCSPCTGRPGSRPTLLGKYSRSARAYPGRKGSACWRR